MSDTREKAPHTAEQDSGTLKPGGSVLGKVLGFSIGLTLVFTLVANLLPQVEGEAPVDEVIDLGALTPESFAALGESLFMGKGTCTLCHKPAPLGRAPDIQGEDLVAVSLERMQDERYQGVAEDGESYIRESMLEPDAYVVKGWGVAGSDDTVSPMPKVDAAPIELSEVEVNAIIAYLQSKDGNDITVELPGEAPAVAAPTDDAAGAAVPPPAQTAEATIKKYGCQACHTLLGSSSPVGPVLDTVGARSNRQQIQESILDPGAVVAEGFSNIMPADFATKMTVKELNMIVDYLATAGAETAEPSAAVSKMAPIVEAPAIEKPVIATDAASATVLIEQTEPQAATSTSMALPVPSSATSTSMLDESLETMPENPMPSDAGKQESNQ